MVTEFSVSDSNLAPGMPFTLTAVVQNHGDEAIAATTLSYYESTDATITTTDTVVAAVVLAAGGTVRESVEIDAPLTPGTYYYGACVDAVIEESNTTNNCSRPVPIEVSAFDLVVTDFVVSDTHLIAGSALTLSATIRNISDSAIVGALLRYSFIRDNYGALQTPATTQVAVIAPSESIDDSVVVRVPSPGTYRFWAWVTDHSPSTPIPHNSEKITVTVEPNPDSEPESACCPDLVVTDFSVSDTTPIAGSALILSATVRNIGAAASGRVSLEYSIGGSGGFIGNRVAHTLLAGLAPSENIDDSVMVRVPSTGTYTYEACVSEEPLIPGETPPGNEACIGGIVVTIEQQTPDDPSVDPRFDDAFWQELVFEQKDDPFTLDSRVIRVLNTTSPNVYIYTGFGHQVIPDEHRDIIREAIPTAAEQLTGQRYRGRIESGTEHLAERAGWITVRYFTDADGHSSCGFTWVGKDPNTIFLNHDCIMRRGPDAIAYLKHVFVHEFGHAMGFMHVNDPNTVMALSTNYTGIFSASEQYHAQLAYRVGRGARYCGWPFSAECERLNGITRLNVERGNPILVFD